MQKEERKRKIEEKNTKKKLVRMAKRKNRKQKPSDKAEFIVNMGENFENQQLYGNRIQIDDSEMHVETAIEHAKRDLFKCIEYEEKDGGSFEYKVVGEKTMSVLCYSCAMNISGINNDYKCTSCIRTYHGKCIKKLNSFDIENEKRFKCATCKKVKLIWHKITFIITSCYYLLHVSRKYHLFTNIIQEKTE